MGGGKKNDGENSEESRRLDQFKQPYSGKFASESEIFSYIHRSDRIFIGTGCGEPQYLVRALVDYVNARPKAFFDAEIIHVWTLGIAQVNSIMPRVHGDGFLHIQDGYGSLPNAVLSSLQDKKHLGVHTELISDGIVSLMQKGVIDNSRKTINRGKTVATFCMGKKETYEYIHDNPSIEFKTIDYTKEMAILAVMKEKGREKILGIGRYFIDEAIHTAEVAFAIRDDYHNTGIGSELLAYITYLAKNAGLLGLVAEVLAENQPMLHLFQKAGFTIGSRDTDGMYKLAKTFSS